MIGGSRQSVNRLLADLSDQGLVRLERDTAHRPRPRAPRAAPSSGDDAGADPIRARQPGRRRRLARRRSGRSPCGSRPPGGSSPRRGRRGPALGRRGDGRAFDAEAASIALYDPATDRLVFQVAAGEQGQGVVGLSIGPRRRASPATSSRPASRSRSSDVAADARFGRATAEQTGYVPRSLVAVPLVDDDGTIGVLEVLDKRGDGGVRPARHRARRRLRPPGDGRDPEQPASSATRRRSCGRPAGAAAASTPATRRGDVDAIVADATPALDRATTTTRCGRSPTQSPGSAPADPDQLDLVATCSPSSFAAPSDRDARSARDGRPRR